MSSLLDGIVELRHRFVAFPVSPTNETDNIVYPLQSRTFSFLVVAYMM